MMKDLKTVDLKGKRVLYRVAYDMPMKDGVIQDDFRITATYPTIDYMLEKGAKIIFATYMGRPEGKVVPELETRPLAEKLADHYPDHTVHLAHAIDDPEVAKVIESMAEGDMLMLPNVRFYPEEDANDEAFGKMVADLADIFVNDAFAQDHRDQATITGPTKYLPSYPGFLLQKELEHLCGLLKSPSKPFVIIMGGAKVSDKIELMKSLGPIADKILIGGAMANTFLLAKGEKIGESKAEPDKVDLAKELMATYGEKLILAEDYIPDIEGEDQEHFKYLDIGPKAIEQFKGHLKDAETIFWNGSLGYTEDPKYAVASEAMAEFIGGLKGVTSIVAGGDTVEMITQLKLHDKFTFISTGGGAALELLGGQVLPGVKALEDSTVEPKK